MPGYTTSDNTKMIIIEAAGKLAGERGFDNVTTRMVADESGQNIGSIHYHFGGKDGLFEAVVGEAIRGCCSREEENCMDGIDETSTPEELAHVVRVMVASEITDMFRSDRPNWHTPVIYQLLQRDDELYDMFEVEMMKPSRKRMDHFYRLIDPDMDEETIHLHKVLMKMPIFSHADYMKAMLKMLNAEAYSETYLQKMEDLSVKQAQLLLGLPLDK